MPTAQQTPLSNDSDDDSIQFLRVTKTPQESPRYETPTKQVTTKRKRSIFITEIYEMDPNAPSDWYMNEKKWIRRIYKQDDDDITLQEPKRRLPARLLTPPSTRKLVRMSPWKMNDKEDEKEEINHRTRVGSQYQVSLFPEVGSHSERSHGDILWDPNLGENYPVQLDPRNGLAHNMQKMEQIHYSEYKVREDRVDTARTFDKDVFFRLFEEQIKKGDIKFYQVARQMKCSLDRVMVHYYVWCGREPEEAFESDNKGCSKCGYDDFEEMVICDRCDAHFHPKCIGLRCLPKNDAWLCLQCTISCTESPVRKSPRKRNISLSNKTSPSKENYTSALQIGSDSDDQMGKAEPQVFGFASDSDSSSSSASSKRVARAEAYSPSSADDPDSEFSFDDPEDSKKPALPVAKPTFPAGQNPKQGTSKVPAPPFARAMVHASGAASLPVQPQQQPIANHLIPPPLARHVMSDWNECPSLALHITFYLSYLFRDTGLLNMMKTQFAELYVDKIKSSIMYNIDLLQKTLRPMDVETYYFHFVKHMTTETTSRDCKLLYARLVGDEIFCKLSSGGRGVYHVPLIETSGSYLLSVRSIPELGKLVFSGYRQYPDGTQGPLEKLNPFHNVGDIIVAYDGIPCEDAGLDSIFEGLRSDGKPLIRWLTMRDRRASNVQAK